MLLRGLRTRCRGWRHRQGWDPISGVMTVDGTTIQSKDSEKRTRTRTIAQRSSEDLEFGHDAVCPRGVQLSSHGGHALRHRLFCFPQVSFFFPTLATSDPRGERHSRHIILLVNAAVQRRSGSHGKLSVEYGMAWCVSLMTIARGHSRAQYALPTPACTLPDSG